MAIVFAGIDLAKNVFAVHGVNPAGKPELVRPEEAGVEWARRFIRFHGCSRSRE
jgi:hypothetical protein